ncbi:MAG TPA: DUF4336 domain-containing protein [Lacunisphaera sp.]|nr:DUF4336 domain-containing protein [Lacunisphaera sp.]
MPLLRQLHPDLWVHAIPYRGLGRQIVVVRLPRGGLWIHSPIPVTAELRAELAALGDIRHVIGPNCFHDECLREFQAEYPAALFHAAPGLAAQKRDVRFGAELSDAPHPDWTGVLEQHLIKGMPKLNEVVFFHPASRTLIIADIAFNLGPDGNWLFALLMRLNGAWGHFGPSRFCRMFMKDKAAVRASIDFILRWDFDRVIVGHGHNLDANAKPVFRAAFAFLGEAGL